MISNIDKLKVIGILNTTLGLGSTLKNDEQSHYCPFCHHHKKKLQVNLETQKWHCWVCDAKGARIRNLLKKLDVSKADIKIIDSIYGFDKINFDNDTERIIDLKLPKEFETLKIEPKSFNPHYKHAMLYLNRRGITYDDIIKYNIGYCVSGLYSNRIIIPSYDDRNKLNYFIARSFYEDSGIKYKNPPVSKNTILFENQINWQLPITICEGIFDAIAIKKNVIPILGKFIPKKLMSKILEQSVKEINIMLDTDAQDQALKYTSYFQKQGIIVRNIKPTDKDASIMGFKTVTNLLKETNEINFYDLIKQKVLMV
jgi:DNA primase